MSDENDTKRPPDDAPVTWGELREAMRLMLEFSLSGVGYGIRGIGAAIAMPSKKAEAEAYAASAEERLRILGKRIEDFAGLEGLVSSDD